MVLLEGAVSGLAGGVASGFVLGGGNSLVTNGNFDGFLESAITGAVIGGVTGAVIGGVVGGYQAYKQGNNIWTGKSNSISPQIELDYEKMDELAPKISDSQESSFRQFSFEENGHSYELNPDFKVSNGTHLSDSRSISLNRPKIHGYANRQWSHEKYHAFPRSMDKTIVEDGISFTHNGNTGFVYPGYVDGKMGYFNITVDANFIIKHRMFYPLNKVQQIWVGTPNDRIYLFK